MDDSVVGVGKSGLLYASLDMQSNAVSDQVRWIDSGRVDKSGTSSIMYYCLPPPQKLHRRSALQLVALT